MGGEKERVSPLPCRCSDWKPQQILWQGAPLPWELGASPMQGSPVHSNRDKEGSPFNIFPWNVWGSCLPGGLGVQQLREGVTPLLQDQNL